MKPFLNYSIIFWYVIYYVTLTLFGSNNYANPNESYFVNVRVKCSFENVGV